VNAFSGTVGVLLGNGDGTFQTAVPYGTGGGYTALTCPPCYQALSVAVADVKGDGKPDLVVANTYSGTVGVLLGNGDGTFQTAVPYGSGGIAPDSVAVADVNGDGKPDLVVANGCAAGAPCNSTSAGVYNGGFGSVGVVINTSTPIYKAFVQPPINADGSSVFHVNRGALPVKFTLTQNDMPTCTLPPATIAVTRTAGGALGLIPVSVYSTPADNGSNFKLDSTACQYIYNLGASRLGVGKYRVNININGIVVGDAVFALN